MATMLEKLGCTKPLRRRRYPTSPRRGVESPLSCGRALPELDPTKAAKGSVLNWC